MAILVDCRQDLGDFPHFWQSTGLTPASLLLNADMRQQLVYAGSVPHGGITYVRAHYLLDLVRGDNLAGETPAYDWTVLDRVLDVLTQNSLKPFFELMGNPAGYFTDYHDAGQVWAWRRLVRALVEHCIARYGRHAVHSWYFETWNEPDVWFRQDEAAFCNYYDACRAGLADAGADGATDAGAPRLGGPGTCQDLSSLFKAFLAHCDTGHDYFTGGPVAIDFISVHVKGATASPEDLTPRSQQMIDRETAIVEYIRSHHPRLAAAPFMNNECDPQVGWWDTHTWRSRPYYAALICKGIDQHLRQMVDGLGVNYALLGNDHGFVGGWGNRTLLARFGAIHDVRAQSEHQTQAEDLAEDVTRRRFEMVKKPVFNVMTMLSLLGDRRIAVSGPSDPAGQLGVLATARGSEQVAVLLYHSADAPWESGEAAVELNFAGLPFEAGAHPMLAHYRIDETHGNPFRLWDEMGGPALPTAEQLAALRRHQELELLAEPVPVTPIDGQLALRIDLPMPGVSLILLTAMPAAAPGQVAAPAAERYEGLTDREEILLTWRDPKGTASRNLRTYEVLYAPSPDGPFGRVNEADLLATAFLHVRAPGANGYYCVRAVDYWGRRGAPSPVISA
jgi:L-iduronidase